MSQETKLLSLEEIEKLPSTMIPIDRIKQTVTVRQTLTEDRIDYFVELLKTVGQIKAIWVLSDYTIVDGRTRVAAYERCSRVEIPAKILPAMQKELIYSEALKANYGGSQPPTNTDIEHTIKQMLKDGIERPMIIKLLNFMPAKYLTNRMNLAQSHLAKDRLRVAKSLVINDGMTVTAAAQQINVDEAALKRELGAGELGGFKTPSEELGQIKSTVSQMRKKLTYKTSYEGRKIVEYALDGALEKKEYDDIVRFLEEQGNYVVSALSNLSKRITAAYKKK